MISIMHIHDIATTEIMHASSDNFDELVLDR